VEPQCERPQAQTFNASPPKVLVPFQNTGDIAKPVELNVKDADNLSSSHLPAAEVVPSDGNDYPWALNDPEKLPILHIPGEVWRPEGTSMWGSSAIEPVYSPLSQGTTGQDMVFPHKKRLKDLWWRSFLHLQAIHFENSENLRKLWAYELRSSESSDTEMAHAAAGRVVPLLEVAKRVLLGSSNLASIKSVESIDRLREIMKVIQGTLSFKTGALVWTFILSAAYVSA